MKYLGHIICKEGIATDPEKVEVVQSWPRPSSVSEGRTFLGLCSYYRRFIPRFVHIARPLHQLMEKGVTFQWTPETEEAFQSLKQALVKAPVLGYPQSDGKYWLDTDASNQAIGAVLSQLQDGEEKPLAYYSQALSRQERQYCVTRWELLAIVKAVRHFHPYLYGPHFTIRTDHAALKWLLSFCNPEGQIARWLQQLQEYDFVVEHRAGLKHSNADALSRRPCFVDTVIDWSPENLLPKSCLLLSRTVLLTGRFHCKYLLPAYRLTQSPSNKDSLQDQSIYEWLSNKILTYRPG